MEHSDFTFELKDVDEKGRFSGYGAVFGNVDQGGDRILPGAFNKSLKAFSEGTARPKMLWQHDPSQVIGVWEKMASDKTGLQVEGRLLTSLPRGKEVHTLLEEKALDGLSIGYQTIDYATTKEDGNRVRELKEVNLWEVSVVTFPMNTAATVTDVKQLGSPREVEQILREAGVPNAFAKLVAIHGYDEATNRLSAHRDDGDEAQKQSMEALHQSIKGLKELFNA